MQLTVLSSRLLGDLEVDYEGDFWADSEEQTFGPHDTEENREHYPHGFVWDCCNELGDSEGCEKGWHHALNKQRGRYESTL